MAEIVASNPINNQGSKPVKSHSRFDNTFPVAGTYRFGEYGVHFSADVVPDDNHILRCKHVARSYTLKAPMLQGLKYKKDYFLVPLSAILPLNYEKLIVSPNIGEDINPAVIGTSVSGFIGKLVDFLNTYADVIHQMIEDEDDEMDILTRLIKYNILLDMMFGSGSLLSSMNCHLLPRVDAADIDKHVDYFFNRLFNYYFSSDGKNYNMIIESHGNYYAINTTSPGAFEVTDPHFLLSVFRDDFDWSIVSLSNLDAAGDTEFWAMPNPAYDDENAPIDLAKFFGYQIICSHFYSNDKVDYIYSAELYRQNLYSLIKTFSGDSALYFADNTFSWNGVDYKYDTCSAYYFNTMIAAVTGDSIDAALLDPFSNYLRLIFGYNRSLRFMDYFTGSRTRPLAVGDAGVAVNDGYVNVVDVIQKRWYIKLWNQVNRVGRRLSEQMKGLFPGVKTSTDWHDPIWLGSTEDWLNASEVDNTGAAQIGENSVDIPVTSSFIDKAEKYAFDININDRYGVVIGISYFDLQRFYGSSIDRTFFHVDRYDKFNPFLQFIGDQKVSLKELFSNSPYSSIFGYQGRYMEYKQKYPYAFGGFINNSLPGMIYLADEGRDEYTIQHLGPDYIRSYPAEFDRFYNSLTGYSLGTYYHFFIINTNDLISNRPMAYNPQID